MAEQYRVATSSQADVLVIGGGITGCATAYYLAEAGVDVLLVEQFDLNTQASGRNAGSLHGQLQYAAFAEFGPDWARTFLPSLRLLVDSLEMWDDLGETLGVDLEVVREGGLLVAETAEQLQQIARKVELEQRGGFAAHLLSRAELRDVAPYVADTMVGAEYSPPEGKLNPLLAAPAFAAAAERHGARVRTWTEVTTITGTDHSFLVHTNTGDIRCRSVVCTTGASTSVLREIFGPHPPMSDEPVQVNVTEAVAPLVKHLVYFAGARLTLKQAKSGSLLIGGGWPARPGPAGLPIVDPDSVRANLRVAMKVVPAVAHAHLVRTWVGTGTGTPDLRPLIGEAPSRRGLFFGMFPHMGMTAGPIMGRTLASLVRFGESDRDLTAFALDRF
jgi:sarcosine oxidase subunit beta